METTIAAISTAMSASGIGIIRISGENAMDVISRIYRSKRREEKNKEVPTHTIHYGYIYDGEELIDEVLVMIMHAPRTFYRRRYSRNRLSWWCICYAEGFGYSAEKWCRNCRTRRIYQTCLPERTDGSIPGRGCYGCIQAKNEYALR